MFLFCWYFDFLCKFKIFNEPWSLDKMSFLLNLAYFFSCKIKDWNLKLAYASQFMQNMVVGSFTEYIKTKIFIKFHFINFMTYLARVANSMVIFSASYQYFWEKKCVEISPLYAPWRLEEQCSVSAFKELYAVWMDVKKNAKECMVCYVTSPRRNVPKTMYFKKT